MPEVSKKYLYILLGVGVLVFFVNLDVLYVKYHGSPQLHNGAGNGEYGQLAAHYHECRTPV